uniref:Protein Jade-1 n=1 Tax=Poecilia reticulata TaxID=8081 RepID=A0A3P9NH71_POERE
MKRSRHPSSSDDSDNGSKQTSVSEMQGNNSPSVCQVFRTDFITAMKLHDSYQLNPEDYYVLADPWRQEWEKGVQVPVSPQSIPQPVTRVLAEKGKEVMFIRPKKLIRTSGTEALGYVDIRTLAEGMCRYDLNEEDVAWLHIINEEFAQMAVPPLDENTMERVMEEFEHCCHENMTHAMETEEGLGIEYDEDVVCDVCQSPDGEDNNEMVFCDKCNICVHQACYGIQKVPKGSWLCRICALGILPKCQVCPKKGGAMKPTRSGTKWVHVSCALWIPEVSIGNPEKMEPITNVSHIPSNRWALICCLCKEKTGACIQCSAKNCRTAFHVTCGLHANLEMNTILTEDDEVKFKSYCPKHSGFQGDPAEDDGKEGARDRKGRANSDQEKRVNLRKLKLQEMEEEFYQFVDVEEVAKSLKLAPEVVDFVYQYWKLKRKANFNQQLLTPKKDEEESLARREQEVLLRRLQLFTHLRQDLERVRNLTYMVTRREKMKRSLCKVQEQIFQHQVRLLDHELLNGESSPTHPQESQQRTAGQLDLESRKGPRRETPAPECEVLGNHKQDPEPEERGRKRRSDVSESFPCQLKNKFGSKHLDKTVSIRLVDIRNSDSDEYLFDDSTTRRSGASLDAAPNTKFKPSSVSDASKANSWLRKPANGSSHAPNGSASGHLKGWGKFRIPKRADKPPSATLRERAELEPSNPLLRPLTNAPESAYPRTRLRSGPEADGYSSDSKAADGELEPCLKRCHSHELRGDSSLGRRYGSDIIRRGVLAS